MDDLKFAVEHGYPRDTLIQIQKTRNLESTINDHLFKLAHKLNSLDAAMKLDFLLLIKIYGLLLISSVAAILFNGVIERCAIWAFSSVLGPTVMNEIFPSVNHMQKQVLILSFLGVIFYPWLAIIQSWLLFSRREATVLIGSFIGLAIILFRSILSESWWSGLDQVFLVLAGSLAGYTFYHLEKGCLDSN